MKKTIKSISRFSFFLMLGLTIVFGAQSILYNFLGISVFDHMLIPSYWVNYLLVVFTFTIILALKDKKSQSLGFVFLAGFFLKIAVFLFFFKPIYIQDGELETIEFASFFVPYAICLAWETYVLVSILNKG